jgi:hypothetical protein
MQKINSKNILKGLLISVFVLGILFTGSQVSLAAGTLENRSFESWNKGAINGYDAGFKINGDVFDNASSIVISLYSGNTLLQTNTAISGKIRGTEFLTPFDVFGTFNYTTDGYFTNKRESEYGQTLKPTKVTLIVTMNDGTTLTTTNSNLNGTPVQSSVLGVNKFQFTQKMKVGSEGNEVMELQKFLNASGFPCGIADGKFGKMTASALKLYQSANKLDVDGVAGPNTRAYLNR